MSTNQIQIRGARTHNLKGIDLDLPRDRLVVITGLSGSGKSSLAFDTLYAEGQRRYVESLSAYARQFLSMMEKPDVDHIEGLSPAISIEQKSTSHNPRSTVGTVTEIHDYLRLLFARAGTALPDARHRARRAERVADGRPGARAGDGTRVMLLAPVVKGPARASTPRRSNRCARRASARADRRQPRRARRPAEAESQARSTTSK
jgi:excinuclease ABC subunit A